MWAGVAGWEVLRTAGAERKGMRPGLVYALSTTESVWLRLFCTSAT